MSIIDDQGRLFGKINVIDLSIGLLVIAVMGRFALSQNKKPTSVETRPIQAVFMVKDVREATSSMIEIGDVVREVKTNVVLGEVVDVNIESSKVYVETPDGKVVPAEHPLYLDVYITVEGQGTASENAIVLGNSEIRIGTNLVLVTNIYSVTSTVVDIQVL